MKVRDLDDGTDLFKATGKESSVAHTRSDCRRLVNAKNVRGPVGPEAFHHGINTRVCPWCSGGYVPRSDPDFSHYNSLLEASEND